MEVVVLGGHVIVELSKGGIHSTTRAGQVVPSREDGSGWPCSCMYVIVLWARARHVSGSSMQSQ